MSIKTQELPKWEENCKPMLLDHYHMGMTMGTNCMILHENHSTEKCKYLIIVNTVTGERVRVSLNGEESLKQSICEQVIG